MFTISQLLTIPYMNKYHPSKSRGMAVPPSHGADQVEIKIPKSPKIKAQATMPENRPPKLCLCTTGKRAPPVYYY